MAEYRSEPHKIVVKCWLAPITRMADIHYCPETSAILRYVYKDDNGTYMVQKLEDVTVLLRHEIK